MLSFHPQLDSHFIPIFISFQKPCNSPETLAAAAAATQPPSMKSPNQQNLKTPKTNPFIETLTWVLLLTLFLCSLFYIFASSLISNSNPNSNSHDHVSFQNPHHYVPTKLNPSKTLDSQTHHKKASVLLPSNPSSSSFDPKVVFDFCVKNFTDYCPCYDPLGEVPVSFMRKKLYLERHCPERNTGTPFRCLVPSPVGYKTPFRWPMSKDFAWFGNVPSKKLIVEKKLQNWVHLEGDRLVFPGGGTSFRMGVRNYIDEIKRIVPLTSGNVRTVLDIGCGVASFGAALLDYNIVTMSIAPKDTHEAQVQFALERGLPAMLGILSTHRLPYPARSFDMIHCARCLVPWIDDDGLYLIEVDRLLRPGGYWVLSGPPINWKRSYKGWAMRVKDVEKEQVTLEDLARRLCWKKIAEQGSIAVWRKPTNHVHCIQQSRLRKSPPFCNATEDSDAGWYRKMEQCITLLPEVKDIRTVAGGVLEKWPKRLSADPPRIMTNKKITVEAFHEDNKIWSRRVHHYEKVLESLSDGKYRNIMDMNARFGGFAVAMAKYQVWVMNVVPFDAKDNTLGVIYERGLIGTYTNWCEAFSTYPRTYDLIHADGIFSMYKDKCDIVDILFEMHRILRPKGAVIITDHVDVITKIMGIAQRMRWNCKIENSGHGLTHTERILIVDNSEPKWH